jgi:hypothetical protein
MRGKSGEFYGKTWGRVAPGVGAPRCDEVFWSPIRPWFWRGSNSPGSGPVWQRRHSSIPSASAKSRRARLLKGTRRTTDVPKPQRPSSPSADPAGRPPHLHYFRPLRKSGGTAALGCILQARALAPYYKVVKGHWQVKKDFQNSSSWAYDPRANYEKLSAPPPQPSPPLGRWSKYLVSLFFLTTDYWLLFKAEVSIWYIAV